MTYDTERVIDQDERKPRGFEAFWAAHMNAPIGDDDNRPALKVTPEVFAERQERRRRGIG